jgi:hypothetical protein
MTLPAHLSPIILSASINQIAPLFMQAAGCDEPASRAAATARLADYQPATNEEVTLAADIVHYRFLAADNLVRSAERDLPVTTVLRLRGSTVSLSREAHKTQRKLDKLQSARAIAVAKPRAQPEPAPLAAAHPDQPAPDPRTEAAVTQPAVTPPTQPEVTQPEVIPTEATQPEATTNQPTPPTPTELAALHAARGILKGMNPIKPGNQGGHAYAQQLRKRIMTQTITQNSARHAAEAARRAADQAA